jgi:uncharacterized protein YraI
MRLKAFVAGVIGFIFFSWITLPASAAEAYTTSTSWLRTGPDSNFPFIERVPRDSLVDVIGCTDGYDWCDIDYDGERGWFSGRRLQFVYQGQRGSLRELAPLLGLMILQFRFGDYWNDHYRERPWYNDRNRQIWQNWHPQRRQFQNRPQPNFGQGAPVAPPSTPVRPQFRQSPLEPQAAPAAPQIQPQNAPQVQTPRQPPSEQRTLQQERIGRTPQSPAFNPPASAPQLQHPAPRKPCLPPDVCR